MAIRLFISDMDDSLLRRDQTVGERTQKALDTLRANGVKVALASGRMYSAMERYVKLLHITEPVVAYNGAMLVDPNTGKVVRRNYIPPELAREVLRKCEEMGLYAQIYSDSEYFFAEETPYSKLYGDVLKVYGKPLHKKLSECCDAPMPKLLIINEPERIRELQTYFREMFGDRLEIAISKPMYLEMTMPTANKGTGLRQLCELEGVDVSEVMACGDSYNDLPMIRIAGLGVISGTKKPDVMKEADEVVPDCDEEGIAQLIERLYPQKEQA